MILLNKSTVHSFYSYSWPFYGYVINVESFNQLNFNGFERSPRNPKSLSVKEEYISIIITIISITTMLAFHFHVYGITLDLESLE